MLSDVNLWTRIEAHPLDDPHSRFPFSQRLARDNGWSQAFAFKAIAEYKRFVYLTCISGKLLTPSDEVDQVWHLHLTYTRDYWDVFCPEVLGRKLHHGPTKGGASEDNKFHLAYADTKALYHEEFGHEPPVKFWPNPDVRFSRTADFKRLNLARVVILPKVILPAGAAVAASTLLTGGALVELSPQDTQMIGLAVIIAGAVIIVSFTLGRRSVHSKKGKTDGSGCGSGGNNSNSSSDSNDSGGGGSFGGGGSSGSGCGSGCGGGGD